MERDEQDRTHMYQASHGEEQVQRRLVDDLLERAFGGSAAKLMVHALATKRASSAELGKIRRLITKAQKESNDD